MTEPTLEKPVTPELRTALNRLDTARARVEMTDDPEDIVEMVDAAWAMLRALRPESRATDGAPGADGRHEWGRAYSAALVNGEPRAVPAVCTRCLLRDDDHGAADPCTGQW